jgi:hypothetical protein
VDVIQAIMTMDLISIVYHVIINVLLAQVLQPIVQLVNLEQGELCQHLRADVILVIMITEVA